MSCRRLPVLTVRHHRQETDREALSDVDAAFRLLTRGLGQSSYEDVYRAHKALYRMGHPAIAKVKSYIAAMDFSNPERLLHANFVNGLFSLLVDLDETEAARVAHAVIANDCSPAIALRLQTICEFTVSDFLIYEACGVRVYESKELRQTSRRRALIEKWLAAVPPGDLADIHRLYLVRRRAVDAAGTYTPILFNITVAWKSDLDPDSRLALPALLSIQKTLYHEIGHHVHRHAFGYDLDQERDADRYAARLFKQEYPKLTFAINGLTRLCR